MVTTICPLALTYPRLRRRRFPPALAEILSRMGDARKRLRTLSAVLEYTKVTVLVNDKSTEQGQLFFHKSKTPEIMIKFLNPEPKTILFKKNRAQIYLPRINQLQEYNLEQHSGLVQEFFLLGFGTEVVDLRKSYDIKFLNEEDLDGDTTAVLELTPRKGSISAHITKVRLWISEESWLPVQQQFFEPGGDYLLARYTGVKVNRRLPASTFELAVPRGTKRAKMN
jgi:outer membrane lipoprotein-sorting protein